MPVPENYSTGWVRKRAKSACVSLLPLAGTVRNAAFTEKEINNMINSFKRLPPCRVAILDDHQLIRKAMQYIISAEEDFELVGAFSNRQELTPALECGVVDLLILDYLLGEGEMDGLQLIKQLMIRYPKLKIIVSTSVESTAVVKLVMNAGAKGFVGKSKDQDELLYAMRMARLGKCYLSLDTQLELDKLNEPDKEMQSLVTPRTTTDNVELMMHQLTPREYEVIRCYLEGLSITQIAAKYVRSRKTISGQKQSALRKLGMKSDIELFKYKFQFDKM